MYNKKSSGPVLEGVENAMIRRKDLTISTKIGEGGSAEVFMGRCCGELVAVKRLKLSAPDTRKEEEFKEEAKMWSGLRHPRIVLFLGVCIEDGEMLCVTEYMSNGDLLGLLNNKAVHLDVSRKLAIARDVALGMCWLHSRHPMVIHRDLKPENLLLDNNQRVKITDFGISAYKYLGAQIKEEVTWFGRRLKGTPRYMAPEIIRGDAASAASDVYSFGLVLYQIFTRQRPEWEGAENQAELLKAVVAQQRPSLDLLPKDTPFPIRELIEECWADNPIDRPDFERILLKLEKLLDADAVIPDAHGRVFWKQNFFELEEVPWHKFAKAVFKNKDFGPVGIPPEEREKWITSVEGRCLRALLVQPGSDMVKVGRFGAICAWLGPLAYSAEEINEVEGEPREGPFLVRVVELLSSPWFHGDVSKDDAARQLAGKPAGTFLVRFSTSAAGQFTITYTPAVNRISHKRIDYNFQEGFCIQITQKEKDSNKERVITLKLQSHSLVKYIENVMEPLNLNNICQGSPYQSIFKDMDAAFEAYSYSWELPTNVGDDERWTSTESVLEAAEKRQQQAQKQPHQSTAALSSWDVRSLTLELTKEKEKEEKGKEKADAGEKEKEAGGAKESVAKEKEKEVEKDNEEKEAKEKQRTTPTTQPSTNGKQPEKEKEKSNNKPKKEKKRRFMGLRFFRK